MRILFLSSQIPFRNSRLGGAKRLFYLAEELARRAELTTVSLDGCGEGRTAVAATGDLGRHLALPIDLTRLPKPPPWRLPLEYGRELASHSAAIRDFLGAGVFDATLIAYPGALSFLPLLRNRRLGRLVYMEDDLVLEVYRKAVQEAGNPMWKLLRALRYRQARGYFERSLRDVSAFVSISEEERRISSRLFPRLESAVVGHGIPLREHPALPPGNPLRLGFIGNYRHAPNLSALDWMETRLLPMLGRSLPAGRLVVAGTGLPGEVRDRLARHPSVEVLENVPDVKDFYARIGLFLNPVTSGRGLRTKLVEAAAFGRPALSTALGAEGLGELEIGLVEAPEDVARIAERLFRDPGGFARLAARNREAVERHYSVEAQAGRLMAVLKGPG